MSLNASRSDLRRALHNVLPILLVALIWLPHAIYLPQLSKVEYTDFAIFFDSAEHFQRGLGMYPPPRVTADSTGYHQIYPNLNHPALTLFLVPFTWLSQSSAYWLWLGISTGMYLLAVALALREIGWAGKRRQCVIAVALSLTLPGLIGAVKLGQMTAPLMLAVVGVWMLLRRAQYRRAGFLLGILGVLKPFLLLPLILLLVRRQWQGLAAAVIGGAGLSLVVLPVVGMDTYIDWLVTLQSITWYREPWNISFIGVLHRAVQPAPPSLASLCITGIVATIGLLLVWPPVEAKPSRIERDLSILLILSVLGSPLGWLYYLPLLIPVLGVLVGAWDSLTRLSRGLLLGVLVLLWIPFWMTKPLLILLPVSSTVKGIAQEYPTAVLVALCVAVWYCYEQMKPISVDDASCGNGSELALSRRGT